MLPPNTTRSLLRERGVMTFVLAQGASNLGDRMVLVALAFAVLGAGHSPSSVGIVLGADALAFVACLLAGGVIADRGGRRDLLVACDLARLASQGMTAVLVLSGDAEVWNLALLAAITGGASGLFRPAATGLLPSIARPDQLQAANGLRATVTSFGDIVGPLLAGVLIAVSGPGWAIAVDAFTFAVSAMLLGFIGPGRAMAARAEATVIEELREGWTAFTSRRWLWVLVVGASATNVLWGAWAVLGPVVAVRSLGGAAAWGAVLSVMGVGALAGALIATRARPSRPLVLFAGMEVLIALPLAALAVGTSVVLVGVAAFLAGAGRTLGEAVWETTFQRHVPEELLSRLASYDWLGSLALAPIGLAIWGPLAAVFGTGPALWIAFVIALGLAGAVLLVRDVRELPPGPVPDAPSGAQLAPR